MSPVYIVRKTRTFLEDGKDHCFVGETMADKVSPFA
jgi:hypothetical protein